MGTVLRIIIGFIAGGGVGLLFSNVTSSVLGGVFSMFAPQTVLIPVWAVVITFCTCAIIMTLAWNLSSEFIGFNIGKKVVILGGASLGAINALLISALFTLSLLMMGESSTASDTQFFNTFFIVSISNVISSTLLSGIVGGLMGFHHDRGHDIDPERTKAFDEYLKRRH